MKNGIRKKIGLIVMLVCAAIMLTSCGKKNYAKLLDKNSPVTITVWHYYNGVQQIKFDEMVKEFNSTTGSEMGIIVEASSKNSINELAQSVIASVNKEPGADSMPDIFATYAETAYQIDKLGMIADLGKYFTKQEIEEYVTEYIEEGALAQSASSGSVLKIFPTAKSTEVLMINLTDWQKFADACGVTYEDMATWEAMYKVAEKYYDYTDARTPDIPDDGKAFFGRDAVANYMIVGAKQLGGEFAAVTDGDVKISIDKNAVRRLWDNFYVPFVKGYYAAESRFRSDDAKIGAIIALVGSTTSASYYPSTVTVNDDYTYPIENVVLPVPNFEDCKPYIVQQGAGMSVIKSDEKTEYACTVFLKWFAESERNIRFCINSGYLPVKKAANDYGTISAIAATYNIGDTMMNTLKTAIDEINTYTLYTSPPYDESSKVRDYLGDTMEKTAKAAYAAAKERIAAGEDRGAVLSEYTSDAAFELWFTEFEKGFKGIVGE